MARDTNSTYHFLAIPEMLGTLILTTSGSPCLVTDGSTCTFPMSMVATFTVTSMSLVTANWSWKLCVCLMHCVSCKILLSVRSTYTIEFEAHFTQAIGFLFFFVLAIWNCSLRCVLPVALYCTLHIVSWQISWLPKIQEFKVWDCIDIKKSVLPLISLDCIATRNCPAIIFYILCLTINL